MLNRFRGELTMLDGAGGIRGAGGPPMEGGYDEGYGCGGFDKEPTTCGTAAPARVRTPSTISTTTFRSD